MPIYMKYPGVAGTRAGAYRGWIELQSAQFGSLKTPTSSAGETGASTRSFNEVFVSKLQDSSSTPLLMSTLENSGKKVTIDFVGQNTCIPHLSLELENAMISY